MKKIMKRKMLLFDVVLLALLFCCIIGFIIFPIKREKVLNTYKGDLSKLLPSDIIEKDVIYSQSLKYDVSSINSIRLRLSTYAVKNTSGSLVIKVLNDNNTIYENEYSLVDIVDNGEVVLPLDNYKVLNDDNFVLEFFYKDYKKGNSIAYWFSNCDDDNCMHINDDVTLNKLFVSADVVVNNYDILWYFIFFISLILTLILVRAGEKGEK